MLDQSDSKLLALPMASRPVLLARLSLLGDGGGQQRDKPIRFVSELFPAQAKAPAAVLAGAAVGKDAPPRRGGPRHLLRASGAANPSRSAGGAAFRAPGTSRPLTTPGAPPHPADGGGKPGRASVRADGELRVDGISFTDPGWTVFHLPSTPGPHGPSDRERAAGSYPARQAAASSGPVCG